MMHFIRDLSLQYADENQDSESSWGPSTLFNKPDYKSFKFIENTSRGKRFKEVSGVNVFDFEKQKNDERMRLKNVSRTIKAVGSSERRKIYIKKNVVDSFLPDIVGFLGKNNYHFIKDSYGNIEAHPIDCCKLECCEVNSMKKNSDGESSKSFSGLDNIDQNQEEVVIEEEESDTRKAIVVEYSSELDSQNQDMEELKLSSRMATGPVVIKDINSEESDLPKGRSIACLDMEKEDASDSSDDEDNVDDSHSAMVFQARFSELVANSEPEYVYEQDKETFDDPLQNRESLSSRSSTSTSASFAFPILISEWPGTPRRMPRADRRYWRNHHHYWRKNLLCCRF